MVKLSTIDKHAETGFYLVKWKSASYTLYSSQKFGKYVIKDGKLAYDSV